MLVFKIRDKNGNFSTGTSHPKFNPRGKTWAALGHISNHIVMMGTYAAENVYKDCKLITFEIIEQSSEAMTDVIVRVSNRKHDRITEREVVAKAARLREFEELKREFE